MPKASPIQTSFNAGELSPTLEGRVDLDKYASGCSKMENFIPLVVGGARKRSGTRFVKEVKDSTKATRLIPFEFNTDQAYIVELGHQYLRVYRGGEVVTESTKAISATTNATPVAVTTATHSYSTGDEVYLSGTGIAALDGKFWVITVTGVTTFTLDGSTAPGSTSSTGTSARVFTLTTEVGGGTIPYVSTSIDSIQFAQSADVIYLAHPDYSPRKVTRTADDVWTMTEIGFDFVPFSPTNPDDTLLVTASAATGNSITLTANSALFTDNMVLGEFRFAEIIESNHGLYEQATNNNRHSGDALDPGDTVYFEGNVYELNDKNSKNKSGTSAPVHETGVESDGKWDWEYRHSGEGYVTITAVETDGYRATANVVKRLPDSVVAVDKTISTSGGDLGATEANPVVIRAVAHGLVAGDKVWIQDVGGMTFINDREFTVGTVADADHFQLSGEDGTSGDHSTYTSGGKAIKLQTHRWSHGAWSEKNKYPRTVTFFEDRLWWAGTEGDPQTLWASQTSDYEDHKIVDLDESAMVFTLNTDQVNVIEWINAGQSLVIGTAGGEFICGASSEAEALVPGNVRVVRRATFGSKTKVAPVRIGDVLLFVQRAGRKLREFVYDDMTNGYVAPDMTVLADHITASGITRLAFQQEPNRLLWAMLANGSLICFTYERAQKVTAWHRHPIGGTSAKVESIATIPHPDGDQDQLWMIVSRTINGGTKRFIEYMESEWVRDDAVSSAFFVDSGLSYSGASTTTLTGLDHLEGESVTILADGATHPNKTVSSGAITLERACTAAQVGLAYSSTLQTMRIEAGSADGTAQGKTKRFTNVVFRLDQTGAGLLYGPTDTDADMDELHLRDSYNPMDTALPLFDGDTEILSWPEGYERIGRLTLKHTLPLPCTITAIMPQLNTQDR